ncbi:hypothetical protein ANTPLA_LOCUS6898 [Anthophora plagiata]
MIESKNFEIFTRSALNRQDVCIGIKCLSRTYRIGVVTKFIYKAEVWDNGSHVKLFGRINFPDSCIAIDCGPEPRLPYPT